MLTGNSNFQQKFYSFMSKNNETKELVEYNIQYLPENRFSEAIDMLVEQFLKDEPMTLATNVYENIESREEIRVMWMDLLQQNLTIACFKTGDVYNEIVGINVLTVKHKDVHDGSVIKNQNLKDICDAMDLTFKIVDIFSKYNVDKYLGSFGIFVNRKYRRCGIATELLKARVHLMKDFGLNVTATAFSASGSQKAAEKAGYECIYKISYNDMLKISPQFDFRSNLSNFYQIQALKI